MHYLSEDEIERIRTNPSIVDIGRLLEHIKYLESLDVDRQNKDKETNRLKEICKEFSTELSLLRNKFHDKIEVPLGNIQYIGVEDDW